MTKISKSDALVTLINVFTVEPANQQRLVDLLARATDTSVRHAQGFISSALHRSLDGTKVTMYARGGRAPGDLRLLRPASGPRTSRLDRRDHGWVLRDTPVFDTVACERHRQTLIALLDAKLKG